MLESDAIVFVYSALFRLSGWVKVHFTFSFGRSRFQRADPGYSGMMISVDGDKARVSGSSMSDLGAVVVHGCCEIMEDLFFSIFFFSKGHIDSAHNH